MHVAKLHLKAPRDTIPAARHRLENALRLSEKETRRLVLVRRLSLGKLTAKKGPQRYQEKVSNKLESHLGGAIHGSGALAANANAVWFRSQAEAERLFLALILSGHAPKAWFWKLAIADWPQTDAPQWLTLQIDRASHNPERKVALGKAVVRAAQQGYAAAVVELLARSTLPPISQDFATSAEQVFAAPMRALAYAVETGFSERRIDAMQRAAAQFASHQPSITAMIHIALNRRELPVAQHLALLATAALRPDRANDQPMLELQAQLLCETIAQETEAENETSNTAPKTQQDVSAENSGPEQSTVRPREPRQEGLKTEPTPYAPQSDTEEAQTTPIPDPSYDLYAEEVRSPKAGIFWVIRLLDRIDIDAAILAHPLADECNLGAELLCHIERSFGGEAPERFRALLGLKDIDSALSDQLQPFLRQTARLADKALRGLTGRRLHDLATTPGWISSDAQTLDVRFASTAADIALRRRALDIDPGWVEWLGYAVHYHYTDTPLDAGQ